MSNARNNPSDGKFAEDSIGLDLSHREFQRVKGDEAKISEIITRGDMSRQGLYLGLDKTVSAHRSRVGRGQVELIKRANERYLAEKNRFVPSIFYESGEVFNEFLQSDRVRSRTGDVVEPKGVN